MSQYQKNRGRQHKRRLKNGCSGKKRYTDYDKAIAAAKHLLLRHRSLKHSTVYVCPRGLHYHVSHEAMDGWIAKLEREEETND